MKKKTGRGFIICPNCGRKVTPATSGEFVCKCVPKKNRNYDDGYGTYGGGPAPLD